jgi:hypothetical protein
VVELASNPGVLDTIQSSAQRVLEASWMILLPTADERARALSALLPTSQQQQQQRQQVNGCQLPTSQQQQQRQQVNGCQLPTAQRVLEASWMILLPTADERARALSALLPTSQLQQQHRQQVNGCQLPTAQRALEASWMIPLPTADERARALSALLPTSQQQQQRQQVNGCVSCQPPISSSSGNR